MLNGLLWTRHGHTLISLFLCWFLLGMHWITFGHVGSFTHSVHASNTLVSLLSDKNLVTWHCSFNVIAILDSCLIAVAFFLTIPGGKNISTFATFCSWVKSFNYRPLAFESGWDPSRKTSLLFSSTYLCLLKIVWSSYLNIKKSSWDTSEIS